MKNLTIGEVNGVMGKKIILVIDENKTLLNHLSEALKNQFYVLKTGDADEAVEIIKTWKVDFLVSDFDQAGPGQMSMLGKFDKALNGLDKVILTTTNPAWKERAADLGIHTVFQKPYKTEELVNKIRGMS